MINNTNPFQVCMPHHQNKSKTLSLLCVFNLPLIVMKPISNLIDYIQDKRMWILLKEQVYMHLIPVWFKKIIPMMNKSCFSFPSQTSDRMKYIFFIWDYLYEEYNLNIGIYKRDVLGKKMYEVQKNLEIIANMLYRILLLKHALHILSQTDFNYGKDLFSTTLRNFGTWRYSGH